VPDTPGSNLCIRHSITTTTTTTIIIIISGYTILVRNLAASHRRFRNRVKTLTMTPLHCKCLYLPRTAQHRNTRTSIHALERDSKPRSQ
jgi:hypothetical protein